jgi:hypothetical protein
MLVSHSNSIKEENQPQIHKNSSSSHYLLEAYSRKNINKSNGKVQVRSENKSPSKIYQDQPTEKLKDY